MSKYQVATVGDTNVVDASPPRRYVAPPIFQNPLDDEDDTTSEEEEDEMEESLTQNTPHVPDVPAHSQLPTSLFGSPGSSDAVLSVTPPSASAISRQSNPDMAWLQFDQPTTTKKENAEMPSPSFFDAKVEPQDDTDDIFGPTSSPWESINVDGKSSSSTENEEEEEEQEAKPTKSQTIDTHKDDESESDKDEEDVIYDISISDTSQKVEDGGEGTPKTEYTVYHISVFRLHSPKQIVQRRFAQFVNLDSALRSEFPNLELPSIPSKTYLRSKLSSVVISDRRSVLSKYLSELKTIPKIFESYRLRVFLNNYDLRGRVVILTGATGGIGKECASILAAMGATLILGCRDTKKAAELVSKLKQETNNQTLGYLPLDLSSFQSIHAFVDKFRERDLPLHLLINNAAVAGAEGLTEDKYEIHFGVNYLGPFLLTNLLADDLKKSAPSRIINVVGSEHASPHGIEFDAVMSDRVTWASKRAAYDESKLALLAFTNYFAIRMHGTNVAALSVHPGSVATNLWQSLVGGSGVLLWAVKKFLISPEAGAVNVLYPALADGVEKLSGAYFLPGFVEGGVNPLAQDKDFMEGLWDKSEEWTFLS
eukprot:TRINITY_DN7895_c0_g1_i1.p1 TRINITY_DN7895_c0_g1~~TRINITY_DN7895_c0_g1_i1.p1  ORF type:complete len:595 (-),score=125.99 TRINITY_DN7895_c0_g1_i1:34-1818(-)